MTNLENLSNIPIGKELYIVETGDWKVLTPFIQLNKCNLCGICELYCPTGCMFENEKVVEINMQYCKGCGICANVCPTSAIAMRAEK
tara:strand:- start:1393 stop:1653 length:261 start_codon:yes stop_codon:yes gene_type:complete